MLGMRKVRMRWPYPRRPLLGRDLPRTFSEGEKVFDQRVKAQFPVGSSERTMVDQLRSQGFSVEAAPFYDGWRAANVRRGIVIQTLWSVRWRATANRIDEVVGIYGAIAP